MLNQVDVTLEGLRRAVSARNDADLARKLGIDQSTISSWKARGRVPDRFTKLLADEDGRGSTEPPQVSGEMTNRATSIALGRYTILLGDVAKSGDIDRAMTAYLDLRPFWLVLNRAVHELRVKIETLHIDPSAAQALILQEDFRDPAATAAKVKQQLREDLEDNPWLADWN